MGYDVFFGRENHQRIEKSLEDIYKVLKKYLLPPINNIEILDGMALKITIPAAPVTRRKLFEKALEENMDDLGYEKIEWKNTTPM